MGLNVNAENLTIEIAVEMEDINLQIVSKVKLPERSGTTGRRK